MENFDISQITTYQAGTAQASMHRRLQKVCDEILKPFGITKMQWLIIGNVLDAGKAGMRVSDLAEQIGTTIPYLTTAVNLMESRSILARKDNHQDSRSKIITLDPKFAPKCQKIESTLREGLRTRIYANVGPKDFDTYMKVLYQLEAVDKTSKTQ